MGAPLSVVSCETKRTRGGLTCSRPWANSGILCWPNRKRLRNRFLDELAKFLAEPLHREILLVSRTRFFSQLTGQRRIVDQPADGDRESVWCVRRNEQCILPLDENF